MKTYATINDIAEKAGVGKGTVDRVLHNRGRVSEETKKRVLQAMEELDYKPNTVARMLKNKKIYRIAVIFHNYEAEFWKQVEQGMDEAGSHYATMGIQIDKRILPRVDIEAEAKLIRKVVSEKYDAIALVPYAAGPVAEAVNYAVSKGIPVVHFNNDEKCMRNAYVGQDLYQSGRTAGELMAMIAKPNARYVTMTPVSNVMSKLMRRIDGFQEVLNAKRHDMNCIGTFDLKEDTRVAYELTRELIRERSVDAIYVSNVMVENVADAIVSLNLDHHILLIGNDNTQKIMNHIAGGVIDISIGQEPERQGYIAIEKLCRKLLAGEDIDNDVYTKIEIITKENMQYI